MKRALAIALGLAILVSCGGAPETSSGSATAAVKRTMTAGGGSVTFREGPLQGGTAVLAGSAAYWVKDGRVYAANGVAKGWSPSLDYSPTGVDYSTVERAVR